MRNLLFTGLLALAVSASSARGAFEGIIEMKTSAVDPSGAARGAGTQTIAVSGAGTRMQMDMRMAQAGMKMDFLMRNDRPKVIYQINDGARTYTEIDLGKLEQMKGRLQQDGGEYVVEKLGEETILGYKTQHVRITNKNRPAETIEMWTSKDFVDADTLAKLQAQQGGQAGGGAGLAKALKDAQADGLPLRSVMSPGGGIRVTVEVTRVDQKPLPASMFEVPGGYTKSDGGIMDVVGAISGPKVDEARKKLEEAMKNMPPEQREMMQKMMKRGMDGGH
jgi:hypothetical protein